MKPKATYTKLFQKILYSTIWSEDDQTRIVWITMLAMCDSDGNVLASIPGLARAANVPEKAVQVALKKFLDKDLHSTTPDNEGRRIEAVDGGWRLLNHAKYRDMMSIEHRRAYNALKQQEYRDRDKLLQKGQNIKKVLRDRAAAEDLIEGKKRR